MLEDNDVPPADQLWTMNALIYHSFDVPSTSLNGRYIENTDLRTAVRCQWIVVHLERVLADPEYLPLIGQATACEELENRRSMVVEFFSYYITKD